MEDVAFGVREETSIGCTKVMDVETIVPVKMLKVETFVVSVEPWKLK